MNIILMAIGEYLIDGYWWLLMLLYQWLLVAIILMAIFDYFINGYQWLFRCKPLVVIDGYFINGY